MVADGSTQQAFDVTVPSEPTRTTSTTMVIVTLDDSIHDITFDNVNANQHGPGFHDAKPDLVVKGSPLSVLLRQ